MEGGGGMGVLKMWEVEMLFPEVAIILVREKLGDKSALVSGFSHCTCSETVLEFERTYMDYLGSIFFCE